MAKNNNEISMGNSLGKVSQEWLAAVGIHSLDDVRELGVVETYLRVKAAFPNAVTLNMLWGLEAAIENIDWRTISAERKAELRQLVGR